MTKANTRVVDLNENLDPTGSENLYLATETTDEKISLNGVQKFLEKNECGGLNKFFLNAIEIYVRISSKNTNESNTIYK